MAQFQWLPKDIVPESTSGTDLALKLNNLRDAVYSSHSGNAAPSYANTHLGMLWVDTVDANAWKLYMRTANNVDSELFSIDSVTGVINASYQAVNVQYAATGNGWTSTNLQDLGDEIDTKCAKLAGATFTGNIIYNGASNTPLQLTSTDAACGISLTDTVGEVTNTSSIRSYNSALEFMPAGTNNRFSITDTKVSAKVNFESIGQYIEVHRTSASSAYIQARNDDGGVRFSTDNGNFSIRQTNAAAAIQDYWMYCAVNAQVQIYYNNVKKLETTQTGTLTQGTALNTTDVGISSDRRLKSNIEYIDPAFALESLAGLKGHSHDKKGADKRIIGCFAQDVKAFAPEAIFKAKTIEDDDTEYLQLSGTWLNGFIGPAMNEIVRRLECLENRE